jgi:hypothetical protein
VIAVLVSWWASTVKVEARRADEAPAAREGALQGSHLFEGSARRQSLLVRLSLQIDHFAGDGRFPISPSVAT